MGQACSPSNPHFGGTMMQQLSVACGLWPVACPAVSTTFNIGSGSSLSTTAIPLLVGKADHSKMRCSLFSSSVSGLWICLSLSSSALVIELPMMCPTSTDAPSMPVGAMPHVPCIYNAVAGRIYARLLFTQVLPGFTWFFFFYSQWHGKSQFTVWVKVHFGYRVKPFVRSCTGLYIGIKRLQLSLFYCSSMMPEPMNPLPPRTTMFYCTKATYM